MTSLKGNNQTCSVEVNRIIVIAPRSVSKQELGELTYYGVCAGCHAYKERLIGIPTETIKAIYANNPEGIIDYMNHPKNLREDYPEMPPQDYLSEDAKVAVADYILNTLREWPNHTLNPNTF